MKIVEAQGYSKEKALETTGLDVELGRLKNATQKWKKEGAPINSKELNNFMESYIKTNKVVGAYVVIEPSADDTRLRPYSVINEVTSGKRKTKTTYQIKEADFSVKLQKGTKIVIDKETGEDVEVEVMVPTHKETIVTVSKVKDPETGEVTEVEKEKVIDVPNVTVRSVGAIEAKADKKDSALRKMKDLIEANKRDYVIEIAKEVTEGQRYAAYGQYTPSKSAKLGKFMFFIA